MFYLTTHSTHFIYGYIASDIKRGNLLPPLHGLIFPSSSKGAFIHTIPVLIVHTTAYIYIYILVMQHGWNGSSLMCQSKNTLHHEWMLYHRTSYNWRRKEGNVLFNNERSTFYGYHSLSDSLIHLLIQMTGYKHTITLCGYHSLSDILIHPLILMTGYKHTITLCGYHSLPDTQTAWIPSLTTGCLRVLHLIPC